MVKDRELKKLNKQEMLEIMLAQSKEIDRLKAELDEKNKELEDRNIRLSKCGSIAQASLQLTKVFEEAQKAANIYVENVKVRADEYGRRRQEAYEKANNSEK